MKSRAESEPAPAASADRGRCRPMVIAAIVGALWTALALASPGGLPDRPAQSPQAPASEMDVPRPTRSVWDGVYTKEQARRGQRLYQTECADCHKPSEFKTGYVTAYDIFTSRSDMPESAPGALSAQEYADLIAYIFEANDMPSGKEELKGDPGTLKQIRIEAEKPSAR